MPMRGFKYICFYCKKPTDNAVFRKYDEFINIPVCEVCMVRTRLQHGK